MVSLLYLANSQLVFSIRIGFEPEKAVLVGCLQHPTTFLHVTTSLALPNYMWDGHDNKPLGISTVVYNGGNDQRLITK